MAGTLTADEGVDQLSSAWSPRKISRGLLVDPDGAGANGARKLSETRGVNLPELKLFHSGVTAHAPQEEGREGEAVLTTTSPLGQFLQHHPLANSPLITQDSTNSGNSTLKNSQVLDICIFLPNQKGLQFSVNGGRRATCDQLHQLTTEHMRLDPNMAQHVFALWMRSPLLELQLKAHHCPFQVRKQWPQLLLKFTSVTADEALTDEPLLVYTRNVMLTKNSEKKLCYGDLKALELLYQAARYNVLSGRYPTDVNFALRLGAVSMALTLGAYDQNVHTRQFFKDNIEDFLPQKHWAASRSYASVFGRIAGLGCKGKDDVLCERYKVYSLMQPKELMTIYIEACHKLPYYGSAMFCGQIERTPAERWKRNILWPVRLAASNDDMNIRVAISRQYISLIDVESDNVLLVVDVFDCSWRQVHPNSEDVEDLLPSFFLHFSDQEHETQRQSKLLQIFTKQAVMLEALLNSCFEASSTENDQSPETEEEGEGSVGTVGVALYDQTRDDVQLKIDNDGVFPSNLNNKMGRLCLASFDAHGKCLSAVGTMKKLMHE